MKKALWILLTVTSAFFAYGSLEAVYEPIQTFEVSSLPKKQIRIRLLALKHSKENIADIDANLAISSVNAASSKGLEIKSIGNHWVNREGRMKVLFLHPLNGLNRMILHEGIEVREEIGLQQFISQQMKVDAVPGDTVIVFTIGHGGPNGALHNLGQRADVLQAIAGAAEENNQRTLWWQLSCYASASLPTIKSLPPSQQKVLSIIASSSASEESGVGIQGRIMEKVFNALATMDKSIDPNQDNVITAQELSDFLKNSDFRAAKDISGRVFAITMDFAIFGRRSLDIPVIDRNNPQGRYDDDYVPLP